MSDKTTNINGDWYRRHTIFLLNELDGKKDAKLLWQIWTILDSRMKKKGGAV